MTAGTQIVIDFFTALRSIPGINVARSSVSRNVFEISGTANYLLYVKGRAAAPLRWGITANVVSRLQSQNQNWYVVLLYVNHETGYLLSSNDVAYYINNVWPLGADGDYKVASGSYLSRNYSFNSFSNFTNQVGLN